MDDRCELLCLDLETAERVRAALRAPDVVGVAAGRAKALGDPTRLLLAEALAHAEELCVCDLAWITGRAENLVSHHLGVLRVAGLARSRREGRMVFYALAEPGRALLDAALARDAVP